MQSLNHCGAVSATRLSRLDKAPVRAGAQLGPKLDCLLLGTDTDDVSPCFRVSR